MLDRLEHGIATETSFFSGDSSEYSNGITIR